jgi:predicted kinase
MTPTTLIVVSGLPASGKTTLAHLLAAELRLPLVGRDDIKERLFESLGWSDREWSKRLGIASWDLLYWFVETQLTAAQSCVIESNFNSDCDSERIDDIADRYGAQLVQIYCHAGGDVLVGRYLGRVASGQRHPGHVDHVTIEEYRERLLAVKPEPLAMAGKTVVVDTTDPACIDYDWILAEVRSVMTEDG